jgi:hypothetical protein
MIYTYIYMYVCVYDLCCPVQCKLLQTQMRDKNGADVFFQSESKAAWVIMKPCLTWSRHILYTTSFVSTIKTSNTNKSPNAHVQFRESDDLFRFENWFSSPKFSEKSIVWQFDLASGWQFDAKTAPISWTRGTKKPGSLVCAGLGPAKAESTFLRRKWEHVEKQWDRFPLWVNNKLRMWDGMVPQRIRISAKKTMLLHSTRGPNHWGFPHVSGSSLFASCEARWQSQMQELHLRWDQAHSCPPYLVVPKWIGISRHFLGGWEWIGIKLGSRICKNSGKNGKFAGYDRFQVHSIVSLVSQTPSSSACFSPLSPAVVERLQRLG